MKFRWIVLFLALLTSLVIPALPAHAAPCPWGTQCLSATLISPSTTTTSTISGVANLETKAKTTQPIRGKIIKVEWWLYHPSFKEQFPANEEGKVLLAETMNPSSGTSNDGTWKGSWNVSNKITARDGAYSVPGTRTYTLPQDGRSYKIESHVLDEEWARTWGGPPGRTAAATVQFGSSNPTPPPTTCPSPSWQASYFTNITLSGTATLSRCDARIEFSWPNTTGPAPSVPGTLFSARWTQTRTFTAGNYKFDAVTDDGIRVKLDNTVILESWKDQGATPYTTTVPVAAGSHTIVVEYYEKYGDGTARFSFAPTTTTPPTVGKWNTTTTTLPIRAIHATLLKDGRVLLIAGSGNDPNAFAAGTFTTSLWNQTSNTFTAVPTPVDMFCSGHVTLANGNVLVAGGTKTFPGVNGEISYKGLKDAYTFNPTTNTFTKTNDMIDGHWYPTLTKLENGDIWTNGGYSHRGDGGTTMTEMFSASQNRWLSEAEIPQPREYWGTYPHMFLMADGRLFYTGGHTFGSQRPGTGAAIFDWRTGQLGDIPGLRDKELRDQPGSVLLPPAQDQRFMIVGGGSTDFGGNTNKVDIVDLKESVPSYKPGPDLPGSGRMYVNLTTLPNRTVLATNGSTGTRNGNVMASAIYNPASNAWLPIESDPIGRNYHSSALLLADGRVAIFGSNPVDNSFEMKVSIYEPAYFGAPRPTVSGVPANASYGQNLNLSNSTNVVRASLIAPGSATHQTDTNARLVDIPLTGSGQSRGATIPTNRALLPPGPYMLVVEDGNGIPSTASWITIG